MKKLRNRLMGAVASSSLLWSTTATSYDYHDAYQGYLNFQAFIADWCYPSSWDPAAYENCVAYMTADVVSWLNVLWWQSIQTGDWEAAVFFSQVRDLMMWGGSS